MHVWLLLYWYITQSGSCTPHKHDMLVSHNHALTVRGEIWKRRPHFWVLKLYFLLVCAFVVATSFLEPKLRLPSSSLHRNEQKTKG